MKTIRQQLTRKLLVRFIVLLGVGGAGVYLSTRAALLEQFDETLRAKANAISSATEQHGQRIGVETTEQFMREFHEGVAVDFFQLRRADGTSVRRSKSLAGADLPALLGTFRRPSFLNLTLTSGFRGRAIGYNFTRRTEREDKPAQPMELSIVVASDRRELDETLAVLSLMLLCCG
ncbi:MAG TPA: sensor histidine kinase N-terminal domain-containing protein, partial [Candidatus Saccharimonadales bacterium]|nr:sensor histidine kinase N-terminal domain-containing protein [Candidatus Saccharimonadales bacterium]